MSYSWDVISRNLSKLAFFEGIGHFERKFQMEGALPTNYCWWLPFVWYQNIHSALFGFVTKHACERGMDRETDRIATANTSLALCSRGKKTIHLTLNAHTNEPASAEEQQEALLLQRNRVTRYVSWNIMAVFWLSYWQEALLIQRNHASTLSVEIV